MSSVRSLTKSLAFASILFVSSPLFAQITYTDVEPDVRLTQWDAHFLQLGEASDMGLHIWKHPNEVVINSMKTDVQVLFDGEFPVSLEYGDPIGSEGTWKKPSYAVLNNQGTTGNWIGVEDRYLGIRFKESGAWHYAWARLDIDQSPTHFTLKDFAVESGAGVAIMAGAEALADVDPTENPAAHMLLGTQLKLYRHSHVSISSPLGVRIFESSHRSGEMVDLAQFGSGALLVRVISGKSTAMLKIVVSQ
jgi:hypothetical protein